MSIPPQGSRIPPIDAQPATLPSFTSLLNSIGGGSTYAPYSVLPSRDALYPGPLPTSTSPRRSRIPPIDAQPATLPSFTSLLNSIGGGSTYAPYSVLPPRDASHSGPLPTSAPSWGPRIPPIDAQPATLPSFTLLLNTIGGGSTFASHPLTPSMNVFTHPPSSFSRSTSRFAHAPSSLQPSMSVPPNGSQVSPINTPSATLSSHMSQWNLFNGSSTHPQYSLPAFEAHLSGRIMSNVRDSNNSIGLLGMQSHDLPWGMMADNNSGHAAHLQQQRHRIPQPTPHNERPSANSHNSNNAMDDVQRASRRSSLAAYNGPSSAPMLQTYADPQSPPHIGESLTCNQCDRGYKQKGALDHHKRKDHDGYPFPCDLCLEKFKYYEGLKWHRESDHNKAPRLFECDRCSRDFWQKDHLRSHLRGPCGSETKE